MGKRKKKGNWRNHEQKIAKDNKSIKKVLPSLPGSARFVREQMGFPVSRSEWPSASQGPRLFLPSFPLPTRKLRDRIPEAQGLGRQFLCSSIWSCKDSVPGHTASFCPSSWHPGDGSPRVQAAPPLRGKLEKGGQNAFWIPSLGNAALLKALAFEKNPFGLQEPDIASSIRGGTAVLE